MKTCWFTNLQLLQFFLELSTHGLFILNFTELLADFKVFPTFSD